MSNKRPDQLSGASSLAASDILIAEIYPDSAGSRRVVKITKENLLSGISGASVSGITGVSNIGAGSGIVSGVIDSDAYFKSLIGGTNLQILGDSNSLTFNVTGISGTGLEGATNIGAGDGLVSGVLDEDIKVKSLIGGTNVTLSASANSITINSAGGGGGGGTTSDFAFFSNAINNVGVIEKTYYPTVDPNIYLSGIDVDAANDLTLYLRWDGPHDGYMGTGYINGQAIPTGNITQLGTSTRRFEGYISGLDLVGTTIATGIANGFTGTISIQEAGAGPTPFSVWIPPVSSGTPKAGTNLGSTDYKGDDTTTGYVTFDTSDITAIKVFDYGVSDGIGYASYSLIDTGDARSTAKIPLTITNSRNGSYGLKVIALNAFGSTGAATESNTVVLDQTYPVISASDPSSYPNGQGLSSGDSTSFTNSIANWDSANSDTVLYSGLTNQIIITNSGVFESPKTVTYYTGVYNNIDNITITAARDDNGATDSDNAKVKIAKPPVITGIVLSATATSATAPNIVGLTEIKDGDVVNAEVYVNTNEVNQNNIDLSVSAGGVSDGSQTSYTAYSPTAVGDGSYKYTIGVNVTSSDFGGPSAQAVTITPRSDYLNGGNYIIGDSLTSAASATVDNSTLPSFGFESINYPAGQTALKSTESATVPLDDTGDYDTISYTSPGSELSITDPTVNDDPKTVSRIGGGYNVSTYNLKALVIRLANGAALETEETVRIADTAAAFTINSLASSIPVNTGSSVTDDFTLDSDQLLSEAPDLTLDPSQDPQSTLTTGSDGPLGGSYTISVSPTDERGEFTFGVSGRNLAAIETTTIAVNPNYTISGIVEGSGIIRNTSVCAGLLYLGGPSLNPSTISMENISEAGDGPNDGTMYTHQAYSDGFQLTQWCTGNADNKFAIVTSGVDSPYLTASPTGDHLFNLDQLNRQTNGAAPGAWAIISQP